MLLPDDRTRARLIEHAARNGSTPELILESALSHFFDHAQRQSELEIIFSHTSDAVLIANDAGVYVEANPAACTLIGLPREKILGKTALDIAPQEFHAHFSEAWREFLGHEQEHNQFIIRRPDGELRFTEYTAITNISPGRHISFLRDITERVRNEKSLTESEERFRIVSELVSDYAFATDVLPDGSLQGVWRTPSYSTMTGYSENEINAMGGWVGLVLPEDLPAVIQAFNSVMHSASATTRDYRIRTKSGEIKVLRGFYTSVANSSGEVIRIYGAAQNITEQKRAEDALKKANIELEERVKHRTAELALSETRYRMISDLSTDYAFSYYITEEGEFQREWVTSAYTRVTGYDLDEFPTIREAVSHIVHPEDQSEFFGIFAALMVAPAAMESTFRITAKSGEMKYIHFRLRSLTGDDQGRVIRIFGVANDVTTQQMAQEKLKQSLEKEKRLNLIKSRFVSTVSHEFRTPLAVILSSVQMMQHYAARMTEEQRSKRLETVVDQILRLERLMDDVTFVTRVERGVTNLNISPIPLGSMLREIIEEIKIAYPHHPHIELDTESCTLSSDPMLVRQICSNLISNAVKYTPSSHHVYVRCWQEEGNILIVVRDEGIGIPEEDQKELFTLFHRAHNVGSVSGTGLGLAIVKHAVDMLEGDLVFTSKLHHGTTFTVRLHDL